MNAVREEHDALLLDLDGTVYAGPVVVPGALAALVPSAQRLLYVTNNASRAPHDVAVHLQELGFAAADEDVVTSSQSAARMLADRFAAGSRVLVVGTSALAAEVRAVGLVPVAAAAEEPVAVVQGHSPDTGWAQLAEAAVAIRAGAVWVATNLDPTLPTDRGLLPGNGSMVGAVRAAAGVDPLVAGKPARPLLEDALARSGSTRPLVVGDRLDTDIAGARAVGARSLLVLTGVSTPWDVLVAPEQQRPDLVATDLSGLDRPSAELAPGPVDGWTVTVEGTVLVVERAEPAADPVDGLRAACLPAWAAGDLSGVRAVGAGAADVVRTWGGPAA